MLLSGGREHARFAIFREIAEDFAAWGHPVLRLDYPGIGLSPSMQRRKPADILATVRDLGRWFTELTETTELSIIGHCGGGRIGIQLAAREALVPSVACIGLPLRKGGRKKARIVKTLARVDATASLVMPAVARTPGRSGKEWNSFVISDLPTAAQNAEITFIYGSNDHYYRDYVELMESDILPNEVKRRLNLALLDGVTQGFPRMDDWGWIRGQVRTGALGRGAQEAIPQT